MGGGWGEEGEGGRGRDGRSKREGGEEGGEEGRGREEWVGAPPCEILNTPLSGRHTYPPNQNIIIIITYTCSYLPP